MFERNLSCLFVLLPLYQFCHEFSGCFRICDQFICENILTMFCEKFVDFNAERDFEEEMEKNGYRDSTMTTKDKMWEIWNGPKCVEI